MKERYKAAVVQMDSGSSREENLKKIAEYVQEAGAKGARLVVLPETADYIGADMAGNGWDGRAAEGFFCRLARENQVYLHTGSFTQAPRRRGDKPKNTSLLCSPEGFCLGTYSKLHMFDVETAGGISYKESAEIQPGNAVSVAGTPIGTLGFSICYDIRFGEMFRLMSLEGAEVFCVCANFTKETGKAHWEPLLRTRAIENGCYVLAAGQTGTKPAFEACGDSMIIDPWGTVLARAGNREEILYGEIDLNYVNQVRKQIPALANRRTDVYQLEGTVCQNQGGPK